MWRNLSIFGVCCVAVLFGLAVPLLRLFDALQPMNVALSIMIAAVFVRLNRGIPSLEWKSLELEQRTRLTDKIVKLSFEYGGIIGINTTVLIGLLALTIVGKAEVQSAWPTLSQRLASGAIGFGMSLSVIRMAYVIWRDLDIIRLQKVLIDASASKDSRDNEIKISGEKITSIRTSGLRSIPIPKPKNWDD